MATCCAPSATGRGRTGPIITDTGANCCVPSPPKPVSITTCPTEPPEIDDKFPAHRAASLHVADQEPVERLGLLHEDVELRGLRPGGTGEPSDRQGKKGAHGPS
jgi:hypothetical protein